MRVMVSTAKVYLQPLFLAPEALLLKGHSRHQAAIGLALKGSRSDAQLEVEVRELISMMSFPVAACRRGM